MSDQDLIERLALAVADHLRQPTKIDDDLWDVERIAAYLKRKVSTVREQITCQPSFPKARKIVSAGHRSAHPLYKEVEVRAWVEKFIDKN